MRRRVIRSKVNRRRHHGIEKIGDAGRLASYSQCTQAKRLCSDFSISPTVFSTSPTVNRDGGPLVLERCEKADMAEMRRFRPFIFSAKSNRDRPTCDTGRVGSGRQVSDPTADLEPAGANTAQC